MRPVPSQPIQLYTSTPMNIPKMPYLPPQLPYIQVVELGPLLHHLTLLTQSLQATEAKVYALSERLDNETHALSARLAAVEAKQRNLSSWQEKLHTRQHNFETMQDKLETRHGKLKDRQEDIELDVQKQEKCCESEDKKLSKRIRELKADVEKSAGQIEEVRGDVAFLRGKRVYVEDADEEEEQEKEVSFYETDSEK